MQDRASCFAQIDSQAIFFANSRLFRGRALISVAIPFAAYAWLRNPRSKGSGEWTTSSKVLPGRPRAGPCGGHSKRAAEEAYRLDETADNRDSEIARLELLKAELQSVFADVPAHDDRFSLTLVPSRPARLWIDVFTYVCVDDENGTYLLRPQQRAGAADAVQLGQCRRDGRSHHQPHGARDRAARAAGSGAD